MSEEPIEKANLDETPQVEAPSIEVEVERTQADVESALVQQVQADQVNITNSLVCSVAAEGAVEASNSLIASLAAGGDARITESGSVAIVAGGDVELENGGAAVMVAGGDVELENGGAQWIVAGGNVKAEKAFVGILINGGNAEFSEDSRVLLNTPQAIAFGAALGAFFGLVQILTRRKKKKST